MSQRNVIIANSSRMLDISTTHATRLINALSDSKVYTATYSFALTSVYSLVDIVHQGNSDIHLVFLMLHQWAEKVV